MFNVFWRLLHFVEELQLVGFLLHKTVGLWGRRRGPGNGYRI